MNKEIRVKARYIEDNKVKGIYIQGGRAKCIKREGENVLILKLLIILIMFILLMFVFSLFGAKSVQADDGHMGEKLYKMIEVSYGDTLYEIALENEDNYNKSINAFMEEIASMNQLNDAYSIYEGDLLVIPYYSR